MSPTPSQKKTARERRRLDFDDISSSSEDEVPPTPPPATRRKADDHRKKTKVKTKAKAPSLQAANGQRNTAIAISSTDGSSDEGEQPIVPATKSGYLVKPPKYNGTTPFETF